MLAALASRLGAEPMATGTHFDEVIESIDAMVTALKEQETKDLEDKEACEADRTEDSRTAVKAGRTIDENSNKITKLKNDIEEIEKTVAENEAEIKSINEELTKAEKIRSEEHLAWEQSNSDDSAAMALVEQAKNVLSDFYADNNLVGLVQTGSRMDPGAAGEAPPPPPSTWDEPYGGKTEQSQGVVGALEMIYEDIEKDKAKAKAEEDKSQTAFDTFKTDSETQVSNLEEANDDLEGTKGDKEDEIGTSKQDRLASKDEMNVALTKIKDATAGCDYITLNYAVRLGNRQAEMDGLRKAKAVLQGGEFAE